MSPLLPIVEISEKEVLLDTGAMRLVFVPGRQLVLQELSSPATGNILQDLGGIGDIWKVTLLGPDGTEVAYPTLWGTYREAKVVKSGEEIVLRLVWGLRITSHSEARLVVSIRAAGGSGMTRWGLRVEVPEGWKVVKAEFPMIPGIRPEVLPKVAVSTGWGALYDLTGAVNYCGQYPSWEAGMQFVSFHGKGTGLYVAAHDVQACLKNLVVESSGVAARFALVNFLEIPEETGQAFELPFETVIGFHEGGWEEGARIYREFSLTTPWGKIPPVSGRKIPQWMKDVDLWVRPDGSAEENLEITKKALEYFGDNVALHWYRWHEVEYDVDYPEYFPPKPGFAKAIAELQELGTYVVPYINGRIWDPASKSWREKNAVQAAAKDERGRCYSEVYGSRIPNNVMCPSTQLWRDTVTELVERITGELGTSGVYIDQICAARGVPCYDASHGHPVGGGASWHQGYRGMLEQARKRLPEGKVLTTEECAEPWLDQIDAHIIVNTPTELTSIPLFAAVYSDRTIGYCYLYFTPSEPENGISFRQKNARAYVYGAQVGWIQPALILAEGVEKEAEFLRNVAHTRRHARPFVTDGQFLRLLEVTGENPVLSTLVTEGFGADYISAEPAVTASAWKVEGRLGVLLCNIDDTPHQVSVPLPLAEAGVKSGTIEVAGPDGKFVSAAVKDGRVTISVAARSAMVLRTT